MSTANETESKDSTQSEQSEKDNHSEGDQKKDRKPSPPAKPLYKRPVLMTVLILLVVGGAIAGLLYWLNARHYETTDDAFIDGHVVSVSPRISAIVQNVYIDDNSQVKKGELLVELDPRDFQAALAQAEGNYASTQGKLQEAQSQVQVSQANIGEAQAELLVAQANAQNADNDLKRFMALDPRARSKQQMDNATASHAHQRSPG